MGQAKARGTRDERVAGATARAAVERAERERKRAAADAAAAEREAAKKAAMTPVQRQRYASQMRNKHATLAWMLGAAMSMERKE